MSNVPIWNLIAWLLWAAGFGVLEGIGLKHVHGAQPLTYLIRSAIPRWLLAMGSGWLVFHFVVQTATKK